MNAIAILADPTEAREQRTPMALLPYQQRWCADKSQVKVDEKTRRCGMSWAEAADTALLAASASGMNSFYIGYMKDMAKEFIQDCADFAKMYSLAAGEISESEEVWLEGDERKSVTIFTLKFASGHRIEALSSAPRNLRGKQGRVIIDEAAFHTDLAELLKAAMALLIWGGEVHIISTHNGAENPFNDLVQEIRAGKLPYSLHRTTFDDAVADGLYERVCLRTGKPATEDGKAAWIKGIRDRYGSNAEEELDVVPKNSAGSWLSRALIEARMFDAPVLRWKPPADNFVLWPEAMRTAEMRDWLDANVRPLMEKLDPALASGFGEDFGRSGDLTVIAPFQIDPNLVRRFPFLLELANCPFDQQREALFYIGDRLPRFRSGKLDARGNGQYLAEKAIQRWGSQRIECVMLSQMWYRENTAPLKSAFEDGTILLPRSADVVDDLRAFQVVKGIPMIPDKRTTGDDGQQRHGDSGVAILLAYAASRSDDAPIEYTAGPAKSSRWDSDSDDDMPIHAKAGW
ncbi:MAG: terminase large subunit domain-containing protein [Thiobacillus sp.]